MQNCIVVDDAEGRVVVAGAQCKHTAERCQAETASVDISTVVRAGNGASIFPRSGLPADRDQSVRDRQPVVHRPGGLRVHHAPGQSDVAPYHDVADPLGGPDPQPSCCSTARWRHRPPGSAR